MGIHHPRLRARPRPVHRSDGSWGTVCGRQDYGRTALEITVLDARVTCKTCLARMAALVRKHGPEVAR